MAILGGSPLGLVGLKSMPNAGQSTFNGGASRNVDVYDYNRSRAGSLFTGRRRLRAWPNIKGKMIKGGEGVPDEVDTLGTNDVRFEDDSGKTALIDGYTSPFDGDSWKQNKKGHVGQNVLHNNDVYDTSILNLVEKLAPTKAALRPSDFAYLKNVGVYPNNRLQICRRFVSPSPDNIMINKAPTEVASLATMISWIPENDNFLEITFGEEWEPAKADFTGMLNSLGEDWGKKNLGGIVGGAGGALPLPGFTEIFQRKFLEGLKLMDEGAGESIPAGNPNLIKEAKVRKTIGYGSAGSGLTAKVTIKMVCEYELKFISGIDPTIVWMDIIGTIVRFGTSNSSNYGLGQEVAAKLGKWSKDPNTLLNDIILSLGETIENVRTYFTDKFNKAFNDENSENSKKYQESKNKKPSTPATPASPAQEYLDSSAAAKKTRAASMKVLDSIVEGVQEAIKGSIMKYRVEMMGVVAALTGNPSTPWHITIGNPLRPVFCSGDMLVTETTLKLGPILAFNDLPSSITAEFSVTNARAWGMQEIMAKFNSGYLRTVDIQKTYFETNLKIDEEGNSQPTSEAVGVLPGEESLVVFSAPPAAANSGNSNTNAPTGGSMSSANNASVPTAGTSSTTPTAGTSSTPINTTTSATSGTSSVASPDTGTNPAPGSVISGSASTGTSQTRQEGGVKK